MVKAMMIPLFTPSIQHWISEGLRNSLKLFRGSPGLRVFKGNLPELENTKMPVLLWELQVCMEYADICLWVKREGSGERHVLNGKCYFSSTYKVFRWKRPFKCQDLDACSISWMHTSGRFGLIPSRKYFSSLGKANHRSKPHSIYGNHLVF